MIKINNLKFLFLYRSFLFNKVRFITDKDEYKNIVFALNIKNKKERLNYIYDEAVNTINKYYYMDLCKFENDRCIAQRNDDNNSHINGCCINCRHLGEHGCVSSNIQCKLLFCKTALGNMKLLKMSDISILKCVSVFKRLIIKMDCFCTKEEVIKDLRYGIVYTTFKNFYLDMRGSFFKKI